MSESDDTDVLLLIPPDLFLVPPSSGSDTDTISYQEKEYPNKKPGVISELVGHMQALETRISAIELRDSSLDTSILSNSLDYHLQGDSCTVNKQTLKNRLSVSQNTSLQNTPIKPRKSMSVPSTPKNCLPLNHTNFPRDAMKPMQRFLKGDETNMNDTNTCNRKEHDSVSTLHSDPSVVCSASNKGFPHADVALPKKDSYSSLPMCYANKNNPYHTAHDKLQSTQSVSNLFNTVGQFRSSTKSVQDMELSEVDELLQEMEATELELSKRIKSSCGYSQYPQDINNPLLSGHGISDTSKHSQQNIQHGIVNRKLDFDKKQYPICEGFSVTHKKGEIYPDISLPYNDSLNVDETDKMISEFKTWEQSDRHSMSMKHEEKLSGVDDKKISNSAVEKCKAKETDVQNNMLATDENTLNVDDISSATTSLPQLQSSVAKKIEITPLVTDFSKFHSKIPSRCSEYNTELLSDICKMRQYSLSDTNKEQHDIPLSKNTATASTNTELLSRKSQKLLSLSDFWSTHTDKSQEEILRIRLEEERFRREHCEHLIQELQKRLLEEQEKVAVAIRVDNDKNVLISQCHSAWNKLKQRVQVLESEHHDLQTDLKNVTEKHQTEITEYQAQIKRCEGELSKALDLAAGYKEKSDNVVKEKVSLLRAHADELENYKSLVQEVENRHEKTKEEYNKLLEKNQQTEELLKNVQQELNRERSRYGEVRNEMGVIHKALDACEAELTVLKQEKESLQLKLKEEVNRNTILEQKNTSLLTSIDDAKKAEKLARDETKSVAEEKEKIRVELQEVYQKQVDEVVKTKLQEFQTQLDSAESEFLEELKTRQQVIAECAARKIKEVIDKHRLEINLLEEKHKEEKRLWELQIAQVMQKSSILETQLNSQRATKTHLAEQLHSVMQKQWQQALQIISGGSMENLTAMQKINAERFFESTAPIRSESMPDCYNKICQEPMKLPTSSMDTQNFHRLHEERNENLVTMPSSEKVSLTSRRESKDDLRKYIKMIAEMQQAREEMKFRENMSSPIPVCREVPRKHYTKKELSIMSEDSVTWQPVSESSTHDISEYIPVSQKASKPEQIRNKPPWK